MLEDTSFAIHPDNEKKILESGFQDIGKFISLNKEENGVGISTDSGELKVLIYREDIVRFNINFFGETQQGNSSAIVSKPVNTVFTAVEEADVIRISTDALNIVINKSPIRIKVLDRTGRSLVNESIKGMGFKKTSKEVICFKEMDQADFFYGFGEKTGFLNKRGEKLFMWNSDVYAPHNPETDPLYQSVPYFMTLRDGYAHGLFFNNTFKSTFDMQTEESVYSFSAEGGQMDYFIMAGPSPKDVLEQYTYLTGRMPLPPKWAIGYHQSRYSYESETEVRELANSFLEKGIPLDVIYLDIHYMDEYRVFTFDKKRFPDPQKLVRDLKAMGIRIVPIVDPGVKEDPEYYVYQEGIMEDHFCRYLEGNIYFGDVWPGNSAFPDFTDSKVREWWGSKHKFYSDLGIEGIWNDMNEPAVFNESKTMDVKVMHRNDGEPKTHRELHNLYGLYMGEATYRGMKELLNGKRPFLLTRAGYSGVQRYAAVWTGDNRSFWEHLQMSLPMVMNLGLSGIPFSGPDVGGFAHDSNGELLARWTQVGAFTPYFRNHSALGFIRQEPWSFGEKYEKIIKKYIGIRYQWLPHLYNLFAEASRKGLPIMRPLFMEYPFDKNTYNLSDQFMIGDNVICAPVLQPSQTHRSIYLPEGKWVNYWTGEILEGQKYHLIEAELDILPLFIKSGSFIVLGEIKQSTNIPDAKLFLHYYFEDGADSTFTLYDDDGSTFNYKEGEFLLQTFHAVCGSNQLRLDIEKSGNYKPDWKQIELIVHGVNEDFSLIINGEEKKLQKRNGEIHTFVL